MIILNVFFSDILRCVWCKQSSGSCNLNYNEIITSVTLWTNREHYYLEFMAEPFYWIVLHFKGGHWLCCTEAILICQRVSNFFSISTYRPL